MTGEIHHIELYVSDVKIHDKPHTLVCGNLEHPKNKCQLNYVLKCIVAHCFFDLQKSIEFWGWLLEKLGYKQYQTFEKGQTWKLGETYLVFVQVEEKYSDVNYHRKRTGLNHVAFRVNGEELAEFRIALLEREIILLYEDKFGDKLFFEDPDRIKIELAVY